MVYWPDRGRSSFLAADKWFGVALLVVNPIHEGDIMFYENVLLLVSRIGSEKYVAPRSHFL